MNAFVDRGLHDPRAHRDTPLVTILAKVIMSGVTPKRCAPKGRPGANPVITLVKR